MLVIYKDCQHLKDVNNDCWNCATNNLCWACKNNGCTNDEKEFMLGDRLKVVSDYLEREE